MTPRVAVTGIGLVCPQGDTIAGFWDAINRPTGAPVARTVEAFDVTRWIDRRDARRSTRFMQLAVAAAGLAHADAGDHATPPERAGVVLGNAYGAPEAFADADRDLATFGIVGVNPILGMVACESAASAAVALTLGITGHTKVVIGACASGAMAIADGADLIRSGRCDTVYAGATQSMVTPAIEAGYRNLRVLSPSGIMRPFDTRRDGFAFAEGAAVLVLERLDRAQARGARVYAELAGSANTNDAHHMIAPSGDGAILCMRLALADAGLDASAVRHVNAHGTATAVNDKAEARAIREVLGEVPVDVAAADAPYSVTSIKGVTGHTASASGAFEAAAVCLSFVHGSLPPTGIDLQLDPAARLPIVADEPLPWTPGPTLSNSFGLGGHNCCLVLRPAP